MTFSINPTAAKTQAMFQSMAIAQNGTGAGTAITGGQAGGNATAAPPAAAPPAAAPPAVAPTGAPQAGGGSTATGTGSMQGGQCQCAVTCSVGNLPAANAQGLGMFGGMAGEFFPASDFGYLSKESGR